jgi:hypothetical protein
MKPKITFNAQGVGADICIQGLATSLFSRNPPPIFPPVSHSVFPFLYTPTNLPLFPTLCGEDYFLESTIKG